MRIRSTLLRFQQSHQKILVTKTHQRTAYSLQMDLNRVLSTEKTSQVAALKAGPFG